MTERASVFEGCQLGVESTPGGSVPGNRKLGSLSVEPEIKAQVDSFLPKGTKYPTLAALGKEWVEASLSGKPTYSEIIYPLSSVMHPFGVTDMGGSPKAYSWLFGSATSAADNPKTFTVEQGSLTRAARFAYGLMTGLKFVFNRNETSLEGTMLGQALADGVTLTAGPTEIELVPVLAAQVDVFLDDTYATLGTTKLTRVLSGSWELTDRYGPLWAMNSEENSFAAHVETEPKCTGVLKLAADAVGMGLLATLRAGTTKFMRILATGLTISGANKYKLQIDCAVKATEPSKFEDEDGVFAIEWTLGGFYDAGWGKAFAVTVVNKQAAL